MSAAPEAGGRHHEHSGSNVRDLIVADTRPCPKSSVCGYKIIWHEGHNDGVECGLCGQWLDRRTVLDIFARPACR